MLIVIGGGGRRAQQLTLSMHTTPLIVPPKQHIRTLTHFQSDRDKANSSSIIEPYTDQIPPHLATARAPYRHHSAQCGPGPSPRRPYGQSLTTITPYTDQTPHIWRPHGYFATNTIPYADLDPHPRRPYG